MSISDPFKIAKSRPHTEDDRYSRDEVRLANRNHGAMLELLRMDVTPAGGHYLLNHFDVPVIDPKDHRLELKGAFAHPMTLNMADIMARPQVTMPVTLECAGNGRADVRPRSNSMPWMYEAVGTSEWTGTPLRDFIEEAAPTDDTVEISFTGADFGFDKSVPHYFGRALTLKQIAEMDVLLVWGMNGQPLLPQHGAPLRLIVPGWYGMASVKWLTEIEALREPYQGYQQIEAYRFRQDADDPGTPVTSIRVKSLMVPPGVPDWLTRRRYLKPGPVEIMGRAWSGDRVPIANVKLNAGNDWIDANVTPGNGPYAWSSWRATWNATPGEYILRCRATDANGQVQPIEPVWDLAGFASNTLHEMPVFVEDRMTKN